MGSLAVSGSSYDTKIVLFVLDNSVSVPETSWTLEKWIAWSISELQEGEFSPLDPWGAPYEPQRAGQERHGSIASGWRCVLIMHKGDEKYHQRVYRPNKSWVSSSCCLHCRASVSDPDLLYTDFGISANHRRTLVSGLDFIENVSRCQTFTGVPGWDISLIVYDWLHIVDLCIIPECAGSALLLRLGLCSFWFEQFFSLCVCVSTPDVRIELTSRECTVFGEYGTTDEKLRTAFVLFSGACRQSGIRGLDKFNSLESGPKMVL